MIRTKRQVYLRQILEANLLSKWFGYEVKNIFFSALLLILTSVVLDLWDPNGLCFGCDNFQNCFRVYSKSWNFCFLTFALFLLYHGGRGIGDMSNVNLPFLYFLLLLLLVLLAAVIITVVLRLFLLLLLCLLLLYLLLLIFRLPVGWQIEVRKFLGQWRKIIPFPWLYLYS